MRLRATPVDPPAAMVRRTPGRWGMLGLVVAVAAYFGLESAGRGAPDRGLLWRAVQICVANYKITGGSFPCLDVNLSRGEDAGFAVVRAPLAATHIVVVPTTRMVGVESPSLQDADAANYFADAWQARRFVQDRAPYPLRRADIGLALNSRPGRSQDQLHIHIDCLLPAVREALQAHAAEFKPDSWTQLSFPIVGERYWGLKLKSADLTGVNVFQLVSDGLHVRETDRHRVTIAVAGASSDSGRDGFYLLAAIAGQSRQNMGHGEFLLDHTCSRG